MQQMYLADCRKTETVGCTIIIKPVAVAKHVNCRKDGLSGKEKDGIKTNLYKKKNDIETKCVREKMKKIIKSP